MGFFDFVKDVGERLGIGGDDKPDADTIKKAIEAHGLKVAGLAVDVNDDVAKVAGKTETQEVKEKTILTAGNVKGIAKVDDALEVDSPEPAATFYTVKKGDTLSAISKAHYGNANKYMTIFNANKPMLSDPDKIYPGQVLRIPEA